MQPRVSVLIPAYNGADYVGEAIQSVLDQTYHDLEIIVVNDASVDHTAQLVRQFDDPRVRYIEHEENRGANAARNTGIRASTGEILAFLDQDDLFHPDKLQVHVDYLAEHPEIGFTYNGRFEFGALSRSVRDIWNPPRTITLADFVLSHLLSPSDMVIRRDWAFQVGLWNEDPPLLGSEIIFTGRLYMAGCKFAGVGRVLNYRRRHPGRILRDLHNKCRTEQEAREKVFSDPRCPNEVRALRDLSFSNNYLDFAVVAFAQEETACGQEFLREAVRLDSTLVEGKPCRMVSSFIAYSISDENWDHEALLRRMFGQLPPEMAHLRQQSDWAVARGYLVRAASDIIWNRLEQAQTHLARARESGAQVDESFLHTLTYQLLNYQAAFGATAAQSVLRNLAMYLKQLGTRGAVRRLQAQLSINRAFEDYNAEKYVQVPGQLLNAVARDPRYLTNRGVLAILLRSIGYSVRAFRPTAT
jgi:glycosyltransferase involved in cell wall biosynthesis